MIQIKEEILGVAMGWNRVTTNTYTCWRAGLLMLGVASGVIVCLPVAIFTLPCPQQGIRVGGEKCCVHGQGSRAVIIIIIIRIRGVWTSKDIV